jgi:hypothetical protein
MTARAMKDGTAKPMPTLPPAGRRIGLDEVLVAFHRQSAAAKRRHDPGGGRLAYAERIADRHHEVSDLQRVRIAELGRDEVLRLDLQHGDVRAGVRAD